MTIDERAREIVSNIRLISDEEAADYVAAHLAFVRSEGVESGLEYARQSINRAFDQQAAE